MKELKLYNTAHPLADTGKPIFIPFGEWKYDATRRQRLDRAHGERIANELNARVARGDPGIPVYAGHPDVPQLAARYPDKGALGWVTKIELANESGKEGLALTVEWDRDPGKGFKWFSPYWFANEVERDGVTYIVSEISSIGLVNNPNIPEFRLANETLNPQPSSPSSPKRLAPTIIELAAKHDRLANEANFDESKHPRANDGKFSSTGGGGGSGGGSKLSGGKRTRFVADTNDSLTNARTRMRNRIAEARVFKAESGKYNSDTLKSGLNEIAAIHARAIRSGLKYDSGSRAYTF